jgi:AbrB family looped-hinge helix DNA binding protein
MVVHDSKVTRQGQTTIPKDIREKYGIEEGDEVMYIDMGDHIVMLPKPKDPIEALKSLRVEEEKTPHEVKELALEVSRREVERRRSG